MIRATENPNAGVDPVAHAARRRLTKAANEIVGQVFYGTLLRTARSSPLKGKYGHGGRGEEVFQAQLDDVLARGAGRAGSLTESIVNRYEKRAAALAAYQQELSARMRPDVGLELGA